MKLSITKHPLGKKSSVAFECDSAVPSCYKRVMPIFKRCKIPATVYDVREYEGKIFTPLSEMLVDFNSGDLDFGWYVVKGHHSEGNSTPTHCIAPTLEEFMKWEKAHKRKCTVVIFPCGFRDNQESFRNLVWSANRHTQTFSDYDWDLSDDLNFPVDAFLWETQTNGRKIDGVELLSRAKKSFDDSITVGRAYYCFSHWHWMAGEMDGVDSWNEYEEFIEYASGHEDICYSSGVRLIEYAVLKKNTVIENMADNEFRVSLNELDNHRIKLCELDTKITLKLTCQAQSICVNDTQVDHRTNNDSETLFELSPPDLPVEIKIR